MSKRELKALEQKGIREGDVVRTAYRGGVREGPVKQIAGGDEPCVVLKRKGQQDKEVKHKPYTLEKVTAANKEESEELDKARSAVQRSTRGRGRAAKAGGSAGGSGAKGRKHKGDGKAGGKGSRGKNAAREEEEEVPPTPAKAARGRGKGAKRKAAAPVSPKKGMATRSSKMRARRA